MVAHTGGALSENATRTVVEADQFFVQSVKLFQGSDIAEVTRKFPLSFLRSQDEPQVVEIVHLPANIQSVDVSITGSVTIVDHYRTSASQSPDSAISSQALRELEAERSRLEDEKRLRQQSFTFLTTYMDSLAQCKSQGTQPEAAQMVTFFDEFVEIGATRSAAIAELDGKLADIVNKISMETQRLAQLSNNLPVKVVVVLSCNSKVPVEAAELTVTYVVKQVHWKPAYDIHVAMTGNTPSPTVKLNFRCTVKQWTGENWENISLALTTANQVSQLIQLPEPKRINISLGPTNIFPIRSKFHQPASILAAPVHAAPAWGVSPPQAPVFGAPPPQAPVFGTPTPPAQIFGVSSPPAQSPPAPAVFGSLVEASGDRPALFGQAKTSMMAPDFEGDAPNKDTPSNTVSQLISHDSKDPITHIADGSVFIPSDQAEHHILVASIHLQAEFMRVVVPSVDTCVYYTCEVQNTSEYVLLPGIVKAYLNDKHVSSTEIHDTDMPQILEFSLAVDTGVKTMHSRAPDALPLVATFAGKATTTYTSATVLHNTHPHAIRGVIVRSSIPLPTDPRITIILKEPAGLADIHEGTVVVKEGCLARWSTTGGRKGKQVGLFEWVCDVNPGTEVLKAIWEICAPQELKLSEHEHS